MSNLISVLDKGFVEVKEIHGSDLTIVNAARVSMGKESLEFSDQDAKLIDYLAKNKHSSPFRQCGIIFHMKLPIFVMRQFVKHRIGVEINEISGRYVEFEEDDFYVPKQFREQSKSNKQGSAGNVATDKNIALVEFYLLQCRNSFNTYKYMLGEGIAKEMARMVLPLSLYTEIRVFMSLEAISHFVKLREESHAQWEIQQYSNAMKQLTLEAFPAGFNALLTHGN